MNKQSIKNQRGITLIALVITIIVMLILVAVTINLAIEGGLFNYAKEAKARTSTAVSQEQEKFAFESGITIDEIIEEVTKQPDIHSWTRTGDTFSCSHCNASYTIGDIVDYTPDLYKTSLTVYEADSGTENQTFTREKLTWIVFGLDKNGTLLITTQTPTSNLALYGGKAYVNGPRIMNTVCEELYSSSVYGKARSMNVDDVNLLLNWTDTRGEVGPTSGARYKVEKGTKIGETGTNKMREEDWNAIKDNTQTPEVGKALTDYEVDGYFYQISEATNATAKAKETVLCLSGEGEYWLASRGALPWAPGKDTEFGPGSVYTPRAGSRACSCRTTFYSKGTSVTPRCGLRPVVPLKNQLPAIIEYEEPKESEKD